MSLHYSNGESKGFLPNKLMGVFNELSLLDSPLKMAVINLVLSSNYVVVTSVNELLEMFDVIKLKRKYAKSYHE
ncbi:hypothetical protein [Carboxylicivirga marina]|uniref:hypothetical protein n=1 Tax=Carboxylicivirga marina TaxID=2800988 RepID=UPI0025952AE2|nr:hypothetical protein [uncultured Carboxylicivirga sp.]